ncbi:3-hydroxybutyryl-CoA dehydrogenase [Streptomyces sp. MUSC 14]|uniref:3-hydroxybutyryl-CoA dehydrogenase n=1 Tax=Streptomyces sp. MUSC 14 TaxID=1354889 RepID=UPI0008F57CAF|nr:3-hydroxybutyryl-CoA dehydrogenase [Streptomyces sp. MUSC 14]OIJ90603.1 3-hydroxybutyryl-CoA dehydrogenase [Streptomyces sp. MUSC 14]
MTVERVGVVGCGLIGTGIADISARAGFEVRVAVSSEPAIERARRRCTASLDRALRKGKLAPEEHQAALGRLTFTADLNELADRQLVFEAVPEEQEAKVQVFGQLDKTVTDPEAILASVTSAIPIIRLSRATARPERVVGAHFFNPVTALPLVEVIASKLTSDSTVERLTELLVGPLQRQVIRAQDRSGFVVNALLIPYLLAAMRMVEAGTATADDIDRGMTLGCGHPMGPLALADLIGLDVVEAVGNSLFEEFREPLHAPPPILVHMVEVGLLGRKTGRGFFEYK